MKSLGEAWVNVADPLEVRYAPFGEAEEKPIRLMSNNMAKFIASQLEKYFQDCIDRDVLP